MMRTIVGAVCSTVLLLAAGPVRAERVAVVRRGGDPGIAEPTRREAVGKLLALLRSEGLEVMPAAEAARRVAAARCEGSDCDARLRSALGVDLLVTVGLWAGADRRELRSVVVSLVRDATSFGNAEVGGGGLEAALGQALAMARSRQALGPGPWLRVEGEPRGALVVVDGTDWGVVPNEAHIAPGEHRVVVRLDGYLADERTIRANEGASEPVVVRVQLAHVAAAPAPAAPHPARVTRPRAGPPRTVVERPVVGPLVLGGVGAVGVGIAIGGLVRSDCRLEHEDRCRVGTSTNATWALVYGAGGALALGAAIAWHLLGGQVRRTGPEIGLGPGSLYLRGDF